MPRWYINYGTALTAKRRLILFFQQSTKDNRVRYSSIFLLETAFSFLSYRCTLNHVKRISPPNGDSLLLASASSESPFDQVGDRILKLFPFQLFNYQKPY